MAIEFDCPYCTATIRVPDAYGGKEGRCPRCDTRLLVPTVLRPGQSTAPGSESPTAPPIAAGAAPGTDDAFVIRPAPPTSAIPRRTRARRRPSRALVIGIPVLCFLVLIGIIAVQLTSSLPELSGELVAQRMAEKTLPGIIVKWSETGLSEEDQETLKKALETHPETLASQVLTCRLIGTEEGIQIKSTAGEDSAWYAVDTTSSKPLALWLKKERATLNALRLKQQHDALTAYCRDKLAQLSGETLVIDAVAVRDDFAFNASGGPLSFVSEAVAGNLLVRCAQEDPSGAILYFCLPAATQVFEIRGRTFADQSKPFGGNYTVVVGPEPDVPAPAEPLPESGDSGSDAMPAEETPAPESQENSEEMSDREKMSSSENE
jgi:hypothetical protein